MRSVKIVSRSGKNQGIFWALVNGIPVLVNCSEAKLIPSLSLVKEVFSNRDRCETNFSCFRTSRNDSCEVFFPQIVLED